MELRKLRPDDWVYMKEWMSDSDINENFRFNFKDMTKEKILDFINAAALDSENLHLAIAGDKNEYLGTISLKNIDKENATAEYAISLRKKAIGAKIARHATDALLHLAFHHLNLNKVYLNVIHKNVRAIKFYEKYQFYYEGEFREHIRINDQFVNLKWYSILKSEFMSKKISSQEYLLIKYDDELFTPETRCL